MFLVSMFLANTAVAYPVTFHIWVEATSMFAILSMQGEAVAALHQVCEQEYKGALVENSLGIGRNMWRNAQVVYGDCLAEPITSCR
jgi:hypothetical protein